MRNLTSTILIIACVAIGLLSVLPACNTPAPVAGGPRQHNSLSDKPVLESSDRLALYQQRWTAVQRAAAHHGITHRDAFYGSRSRWHAARDTPARWTLDHPGDLIDPVYIDGRAHVLIAGDARATIEVNSDAIIHILGDLDATLDLRGVCEVIVAGSLTPNATIICDGSLDLYVQGDSDAILGATGTATLIINGDAAGVIQCGAPATLLTVLGDLDAEIPAPTGKNAILTLRVDGYTPAATMLDLTDTGFTRVNATLGRSNVPPGHYPQTNAMPRPTTRWVVLQERR